MKLLVKKLYYAMQLYLSVAQQGLVVFRSLA